MKLIGLVRLGADAETRYTGSGDAVTSFTGAFNYGRKDGEGNRPTQWVKFSVWGERGEKLAPYLKKGKRFLVDASEPHIETYEKRDGGTGFTLVARVDQIEFADSRDDGDQAPRQQTQGRAPAAAAAPAQRQAPAARAPSGGGSGFDDMDDDIPFLSFHAGHDPLFSDRKAARLKAAR